MLPLYSKLDISMDGTLENTIEMMRKRAGVTQEILGHSVGVTRQTIIALEKGNYIPSVLLAMKITKYFKTSVEYIFKMHL